MNRKTLSRKYPFAVIAALLLFGYLTGDAAALVFPEKRRVEIIERLELLLEYNRPERTQLRLLPDPFEFGRTIAEEKPTQEIEGVDDEDLLEQVADLLSGNILGFQNFGTRAFFPTRDFGLLGDGDTVTIELPDQGGQPVSVQIVSPSRSGFTIRLNENLETFVPANSMPTGIRPTGSPESNPVPNAP